jgi:hypothetical protein
MDQWKEGRRRLGNGREGQQEELVSKPRELTKDAKNKRWWIQMI